VKVGDYIKMANETGKDNYRTGNAITDYTKAIKLDPKTGPLITWNGAKPS
jgi:hypothetical protein